MCGMLHGHDEILCLRIISLLCNVQNNHMDKIVIEPSIMEDPMIANDEDFVDIRARFKTWNEGKFQILHTIIVYCFDRHFYKTL